jgi:hypothetical protein
MVPVLKSHLQIYNQLIVIYFTFLYDFLTSKAVKCSVCFEESDQKAINPISTALGVTLFVLVVLAMFICLKTESKLGELFYDKLKCCGEFVWSCLTCQCLRECCTTWAGSCITLVSSVGGHSARNHSDNMVTEMNEVPEASGSTAATTSVSDFVEPPPSYNSINVKLF